MSFSRILPLSLCRSLPPHASLSACSEQIRAHSRCASCAAGLLHVRAEGSPARARSVKIARILLLLTSRPTILNVLPGPVRTERARTGSQTGRPSQRRGALSLFCQQLASPLSLRSLVLPRLSGREKRRRGSDRWPLTPLHAPESTGGLFLCCALAVCCFSPTARPARRCHSRNRAAERRTSSPRLPSTTSSRKQHSATTSRFPAPFASVSKQKGRWQMRRRHPKRL